jgi:F-type H+-transporting ATPase subunit b
MGHADPGLFIWALIAFGVLLAALAKFAYKPLHAAMKHREETIQASLDEAKQAREQARELLDRNEQQLQAAREETRHIIDEGHRLVDEMKREGEEEARVAAQQILDKSRRELQREAQKSLDELKGAVAGLSVRVARQVMREGIDEKRHEELTDTFIERLKKSYANRDS